jgi:hypothetical protein
MTKARNILGLAFEDHSILAAEVHMRGDRPSLQVVGEFVLSNDFSAAGVTEQGQRLRQFLKENGFSAKTVVVGLPAKWLVAKELTLPPTNAAALSGIMNIQAERAFSLDPRDLVFDYYGSDQPDNGGTLLLMAMQQKRLSHIQMLTKAAGLSVLAVTPTSHALRSLSGDGRSDLAIYVRDGYIESWSSKADLPWIRHGVRLPQQAEDLAKALQEQIARLLSVAPGDGQSSRPNRVMLYTGSTVNGESIGEISRSFSDQVEISDGDAHLLSAGFGADQASKVGTSGAAAALALASVQGKALFVDFLHSRMVPGKRIPQTRTLVWAGIASLTIFAALVAVIWGWRQDVKDIATFTEQLTVMSEDIKAAREVVERVSYASGWISRRPEFLECLSQLTRAFPAEGTIWASNLALHENKQGLVTGKSLREESVLLVLDAIKLNDVFQNVQMVYMRDAGRGTNEVSFAIQFKFSGGS